MTGFSLVWLLPAVLALVEWYAVWRRDRRTQTWAKPAVLIALIVTALVLGATDDAAGIWLLVALVFGLAGDVFLLGESDTRFRLGLAAFLVGHLAYVGSFIQLGARPAELELPGLPRARRLPARDPPGRRVDVPPRRARPGRAGRRSTPS